MIILSNFFLFYRLSELASKIESLENKRDLDDKGEHIIKELDKHGEEMTEDIFLNFVHKAGTLIESTSYLKIVQARKYLNINIMVDDQLYLKLHSKLY